MIRFIPSLLFKQYEIYSKARLAQGSTRVTFEQSFSSLFREQFHGLSDLSALHLSTAFLSKNGVDQLRGDLMKLLSARAGSDTSGITDTLGICKSFLLYRMYEDIEPIAQRLLREDDDRRYVIQDSILIPTDDGATLSAIVVRKRGVSLPQPAGLFFNIYTDLDLNQAKQAAARGYVGVSANPRGKRLSPESIEPYEHEAKDTYAVIDWISKQPWSNGKVGMYGGSYTGFAQWAATKNLHPALKTIVPYVANNPGSGLPMENNIFLFVNYAWAFYVTNNKYLDNETYFNSERWNSLNERWYASGRSYRAIDSVDGTPNKWLHRWLDHPGYDKYWQEMTPYKVEFSKINIPILTITGYYDDGQQSAVSYLKDHYKYNPNADHYLVIGPYDHFGAQSSSKPAMLRGYAIDSVAQMDTPELTFQWLDYVMRGGTKPALLADKINYEVMGSNIWKHAPTLEKMRNKTLTLYLTDTKAGNHYLLSEKKPQKRGFLSQDVDFTDRKTSNNDYYPDLVVGKKPDLSNGYSFISEPFDSAVEISGNFEGEIRASINKKDMDVGVVLYGVLPGGELIYLSYFTGRASYANDMSVRNLLTPGKVESIPFTRTRMVSRKLGKGSRLFVTLNVNKNAFAQINYGTGKDVSSEDIRDGKTPLRVQWQNDSFVKIPIWK